LHPRTHALETRVHVNWVDCRRASLSFIRTHTLQTYEKTQVSHIHRWHDFTLNGSGSAADDAHHRVNESSDDTHDPDPGLCERGRMGSNYNSNNSSGSRGKRSSTSNDNGLSNDNSLSNDNHNVSILSASQATTNNCNIHNDGNHNSISNNSDNPFGYPARPPAHSNTHPAHSNTDPAHSNTHTHATPIKSRSRPIAGSTSQLPFPGEISASSPPPEISSSSFLPLEESSFPAGVETSPTSRPLRHSDDAATGESAVCFTADPQQPPTHATHNNTPNATLPRVEQALLTSAGVEQALLTSAGVEQALLTSAGVEQAGSRPHSVNHNNTHLLVLGKEAPARPLLLRRTDTDDTPNAPARPLLLRRTDDPPNTSTTSPAAGLDSSSPATPGSLAGGGVGASKREGEASCGVGGPDGDSRPPVLGHVLYVCDRERRYTIIITHDPLHGSSAVVRHPLRHMAERKCRGWGWGWGA
jgi:hypothetical protein